MDVLKRKKNWAESRNIMLHFGTFSVGAREKVLISKRCISTMVPVCRWGTHKIKSYQDYFYLILQLSSSYHHHPTWPSGLRLHASNQKVPSSIPGEAFCILFQENQKKTFFFINFKEVLCKTAKKREAKTLKNNSKKPLKNAGCW